MKLLFDIGGTKTRVAVSDDGEIIAEPVIIPTPPDFDELMRSFETAARSLLGGAKPDRVAGGIAGPLNREKSALANASQSNWVAHPLKQTLEEMFGAPVLLENDAALAGLGEAQYGAGRGYKIIAYLTMSTGVGGARIVNGAIDANARGFEPGFHIIEATSRLTFEGAVSGRALEARYGKKPEAITDPAVWDEVADKLAIGVHNAIIFWSPDIVILGGGIMGSVPLERVRAQVGALHTPFPEIPPIERSALGDSAGLWGALVLSST